MELYLFSRGENWIESSCMVTPFEAAVNFLLKKKKGIKISV